MSRPQSLQEVADDAVSGCKSFGHALDATTRTSRSSNGGSMKRRISQATLFRMRGWAR